MSIVRSLPKACFLIAIALSTSLKLGAQPTWSQILNDTNSNDTSELTGQYYQLNNGSITTASNTYVAAYPTMQIPSSPGTYTDDTYCESDVPSWWTASVPMDGPSRAPSSRIVSNYGPASGYYTGVGFYGYFGGATMLSGTINEAVYFHEQRCYFGGREYGFSYDPVADNLIAYWSTNTNCTSSFCSAPSGYNSGTEISGPTSGTFTEPGSGWGSVCNSMSSCFFEMYPVQDGSDCYFQVNIVGPSPDYTPLFGMGAGPGGSNTGQMPLVDASGQANVLNADPNFCSSSIGILNETGYVTATIQYSSGSASIPSSVEVGLDQESFTSGIFVGK